MSTEPNKPAPSEASATESTSAYGNAFGTTIIDVPQPRWSEQKVLLPAGMDKRIKAANSRCAAKLIKDSIDNVTDPDFDELQHRRNLLREATQSLIKKSGSSEVDAVCDAAAEVIVLAAHVADLANKQS
ncbi:MAG: hypothetical protein KDD66_03470 [Bdellovibrionales bacterium]|nr:hypothetical protein [Bdellovibrionales bacterium]